MFLARSDDFSRLNAGNDWSRYYSLKIFFWKIIFTNLSQLGGGENNVKRLAVDYYAAVLRNVDICRDFVILAANVAFERAKINVVFPNAAAIRWGRMFG